MGSLFSTLDSCSLRGDGGGGRGLGRPRLLPERLKSVLADPSSGGTMLSSDGSGCSFSRLRLLLLLALVRPCSACPGVPLAQVPVSLTSHSQVDRGRWHQAASLWSTETNLPQRQFNSKGGVSLLERRAQSLIIYVSEENRLGRNGINLQLHSWLTVNKTFSGVCHLSLKLCRL